MAASPELKQLLVRIRPGVHQRLPGIASRKGYRSVNEYVSTLLEAEVEQDKTQLAALREADKKPAAKTAKKAHPAPAKAAKAKKAKRNDKPQPMPKAAKGAKPARKAPTPAEDAASAAAHAAQETGVPTAVAVATPEPASE